jgi:hypothetical protein
MGKAIEIAEWAITKLPEITKIDDDHHLLDIYEINSQAVSGINYKLVIDVSIGYGNDNKVESIILIYKCCLSFLFNLQYFINKRLSSALFMFLIGLGL